jgi:hypothetical protein
VSMPAIEDPIINICVDAVRLKMGSQNFIDSFAIVQGCNQSSLLDSWTFYNRTLRRNEIFMQA